MQKPERGLGVMRVGEQPGPEIHQSTGTEQLARTGNVQMVMDDMKMVMTGGVEMADRMDETPDGRQIGGVVRRGEKREPSIHES